MKVAGLLSGLLVCLLTGSTSADSVGWSRWSPCSKKCGGGIRHQMYICDDSCITDLNCGKVEVEDCNVQPCRQAAPVAAATNKVEVSHSAREVENANIGEARMFTCTMEPAPADSDLLTNLKWYHRATEITTDGPVRVSAEMGDGMLMLTFDSVEESQAGNYTCTGTDGAQSDSESFKLDIIKRMALTSPLEQFGILGEEGHIECVVDGNPAPIITWKDSNNQPIVTGGRIIVTNDKLTIKDLTMDDEAVYACHAWQKAINDYKVNKINFEVVTVLTGECGTRPYFDSKQFRKSPRDVSRPRPTRIIGGHFAEHGEYPWQARIHVLAKVNHSLFDKDSKHKCGAAIINDHWLLTAAHCVDDYEISKYRIIVGDRDIRETEPAQQTFHIDKLIMHDYDTVLKSNDIALIKVRPNHGKGIQFSDVVQPACLPTDTTPHTEGLECLVSGWGYHTIGKKSSDELKGAVVKIWNEDKCRSEYSLLDDGMMCAGVSEGHVSTCYADSGGPLVVKTNGAYTLLGLTSFGRRGCPAGMPAVYTRVAHFLPWIQDKMAANSECGEDILPKP